MINSQFTIDYLTRHSDEDHKQNDTSGSEGDFARTPSSRSSSSPEPSENESSCSENAESIAQVLLSLDQSLKNGLCSSDANEKPPHSYIAMISMAILSTPDKKILLNDIYQYIMDNFPYYNNKEKAWRNSIRHNLSLNECFVKNGRSDNGKGNFWSVHPACIEDFSKGDFRRRQARRRARKSSVKSVSGTPECGTRYSMGYVPMTSSQIGFHPYHMNSHTVHVPQHNPYQIFHTPGSTFETTGKTFSNDASFNAAVSIGRLASFNSHPTFCTTPSFAASVNPGFYSSCQRGFST